MDDELFHSGLCIEDDCHGTGLGVEGMEESSKEEADKEDEINVEESYLMKFETPTGKDGQMIESYDKRELISIPEVMETEPFEGLEFESDDSAWKFYGLYAERTGFKACCSADDNLVISRRFACCSKREFLSENGQLSSTQQEVIPNVSCMARLVVKKQSSGKWVATEFQREHNHETMGQRGIDLKPFLVSNITKAENSVEDRESPSQERELVLIWGDPSLEPCQGMEFPSVEAARLYYNAYAKDIGFTVRISKCRRAREGTIICRRFVCSKEGYYVRKYGRTKRSRALTRVGCMARLVVKKMDSGVWVVSNFEKEHNHPPFITGKDLNYQPPNPTRRMSGSSRTVPEGSTRPVLSPQRLDIQNNQNSLTWRFDKLHEEGIKFAEEGASSLEIFNVAMLALQEATQKVLSVKKSIALDTDNGSNDGINRDANLMTNNLKNKTRKNLYGSCNNSSRGTDPEGLIQHPVNLVFTSSGIQNQSSKGPVSSNNPDSQILLRSTDNRALNITAHVPHQMMSSAQIIERCGSTSESISTSGKKSQLLDDSFTEKHSKGNNSHSQIIERCKLTCESISTSGKKSQLLEDSATKQHSTGNNSHSQECEIFSDSCANSGGCTASVSISNVQVAALEAVAEVFNVHTTGTTSLSALPLKVSSVSREFSKSSRRRNNLGRHGFPKAPSGTNPLVHAAAIAAGARIVPPGVAASLMKAVQSRPAIHIRSGGFIPKLPFRTRELSPNPNVSFGHSMPNGTPYSDSHEICLKDPPSEAQTPAQDNHVGNNITDASSDLKISTDTPNDFLNLKAGDDWMLQVVGNPTMDQQLCTGSLST